MFRVKFKPKNPYKLHATSRKAGGHTSIKYLKDKQHRKEVDKLIKEELKDV